jgi:hypothetical protein
MDNFLIQIGKIFFFNKENNSLKNVIVALSFLLRLFSILLVDVDNLLEKAFNVSIFWKICENSFRLIHDSQSARFELAELFKTHANETKFHDAKLSNVQIAGHYTLECCIW